MEMAASRFTLDSLFSLLQSLRMYLQIVLKLCFLCFVLRAVREASSRTFDLGCHFGLWSLCQRAS